VHVSPSVEWTLTAALLVALLCVVARPSPVVAMRAALALTTFLLLLDQSRLRPTELANWSKSLPRTIVQTSRPGDKSGRQRCLRVDDWPQITVLALALCNNVT